MKLKQKRSHSCSKKSRYICPSCRVPFADHMGLVGTCAELQQTRLIMLRLLDDLARLGVEFARDLRLNLDAVGDTKCKATVATKGH